MIMRTSERIQYLKEYYVFLYHACCVLGVYCIFKVSQELVHDIVQIWSFLAFRIQLKIHLLIPTRIKHTWRLFHNYILPYVTFLKDAKIRNIIDVIKKTALTQPIPEIPGTLMTSNYMEFMNKSCKYVLMATAHINREDILWYNINFPYIMLSEGAKVQCPNVFIVKDTENKKICVVIKGTNSLNDLLLDLALLPIQTSSGSVHEGAGKCALFLIHDNDFNKALKEALYNNKGYDIEVIGHSLGASIGALLCIFWRKYKMYTEVYSECILFACFPCLCKDYKDKGEQYIHIFVNEDDNIPRFCADQGELLSQHLKMCYNNKDTDLPSLESQVQELTNNIGSKYDPCDIQPLNFTLPGTIYYMNQCIKNECAYRKYETQKLDVYRHLFFYSFLQFFYALFSFHYDPSCKIFPGSEFPKGVRLHPWFFSHHQCENYEIVLQNTKNSLYK
ncbi:hypothetical protein WA158_007191 [Blastocystis sp. Blastoise]